MILNFERLIPNKMLTSRLLRNLAAFYRCQVLCFISKTELLNLSADIWHGNNCEMWAIFDVFHYSVSKD